MCLVIQFLFWNIVEYMNQHAVLQNWMSLWSAIWWFINTVNCIYVVIGYVYQLFWLVELCFYTYIYGSIYSNLKILHQNIEIHVHLIIIKPTNSLVLIINDNWGWLNYRFCCCCCRCCCWCCWYFLTWIIYEDGKTAYTIKE